MLTFTTYIALIALLFGCGEVADPVDEYAAGHSGKDWMLSSLSAAGPQECESSLDWCFSNFAQRCVHRNSWSAGLNLCRNRAGVCATTDCASAADVGSAMPPQVPDTPIPPPVSTTPAPSPTPTTMSTNAPGCSGDRQRCYSSDHIGCIEVRSYMRSSDSYGNLCQNSVGNCVSLDSGLCFNAESYRSLYYHAKTLENYCLGLDFCFSQDHENARPGYGCIPVAASARTGDTYGDLCQDPSSGRCMIIGGNYGQCRDAQFYRNYFGGDAVVPPPSNQPSTNPVPSPGQIKTFELNLRSAQYRTVNDCLQDLNATDLQGRGDSCANFQDAAGYRCKEVWVSSFLLFGYPECQRNTAARVDSSKPLLPFFELCTMVALSSAVSNLVKPLSMVVCSFGPSATDAVNQAVHFSGLKTAHDQIVNRLRSGANALGDATSAAQYIDGVSASQGYDSYAYGEEGPSSVFRLSSHGDIDFTDPNYYLDETYNPYSYWEQCNNCHAIVNEWLDPNWLSANRINLLEGFDLWLLRTRALLEYGLSHRPFESIIGLTYQALDLISLGGLSGTHKAVDEMKACLSNANNGGCVLEVLNAGFQAVSFSASMLGAIKVTKSVFAVKDMRINGLSYTKAAGGADDVQRAASTMTERTVAKSEIIAGDVTHTSVRDGSGKIVGMGNVVAPTSQPDRLLLDVGYNASMNMPKDVAMLVEYTVFTAHDEIGAITRRIFQTSVHPDNTQIILALLKNGFKVHDASRDALTMVLDLSR